MDITQVEQGQLYRLAISGRAGSDDWRVEQIEAADGVRLISFARVGSLARMAVTEEGVVVAAHDARLIGARLIGLEPFRITYD